MSDIYRPEMVVHVLSHPDCGSAAMLEDYLFRLLVQDPADESRPGLNIPFFSWRNQKLGATGRPDPFSLENVHHGVIIALVDGHMARSPEWGTLIAALVKQVSDPFNSHHRLLPVILSPKVFEINPGLLGSMHAIRLYETKIVDQPRTLGVDILHELCRLLFSTPRKGRSHAPVQLFLSHAKKDGTEIAQAIKNHLCHRSPMGAFFDARDIAPGHSFVQEIEGAIGDANATLVAIQTDAYASREWCQREVLEAKRLEKPVVVINAVDKREIRQFPYLGNTPSIRWQTAAVVESCQQVVEVILMETLRTTYFKKLINNMLTGNTALESCRGLGAPPELVTLLHVDRLNEENVNTIVYPDPPLGSVELELLQKMRPGLSLVTPFQLGAKA